MNIGPLGGIRLIEMDAIGPVPLASMILSGLGAEILRIQRPGGHQAWDDVGEAVLLRGRTVVELNLKSGDDMKKFLKLVEGADGLLEGGRPGVMERLGLGPDVCLSHNPRLVYARMTGWGQEGALRLAAGHDINYIAMTGALHAIGPQAGPPTVPLNLIGDYAGGAMFLALGVVSAVLHAKQTGQGQVVDAAMVDGVANLLSLFHAFMSSGSWQDAPGSNLLDGAAPFYRCYACADGRYVAVGALEPQFFAQLIEVLGIPANRYNQSDRSQWPMMESEFSAVFRSAGRDEWERRFEGRDACVSPVLSMREAMNHPINAERGVFVQHNGVMQAAPAPRFSKTAGGVTQSRRLSAEEAIHNWSEGADK